MKKCFRIMPVLLVVIAGVFFVSCAENNDSDKDRERFFYVPVTDSHGGQYRFYTNYWEDEDSYFHKIYGTTTTTGAFEIEAGKRRGSDDGGFGLIFDVTEHDGSISDQGKIDCYRLVITSEGLWQFCKQKWDTTTKEYKREYYKCTDTTGLTNLSDPNDPDSNVLLKGSDQRKVFNKIRIERSVNVFKVILNGVECASIPDNTDPLPVTDKVGLITGVTNENFPNHPVDVRYNIVTPVTPLP